MGIPHPAASISLAPHLTQYQYAQVIPPSVSAIDASALRALFDSSPLMMGIVELVEGDFVYRQVNASCAHFHGMKASELEGCRASQLGAPPVLLSGWLKRFEEARSTGASVTFQYWHGDRHHSATVSHVEGQRFTYAVSDTTHEQQLTLAVTAAKVGFYDWNVPADRMHFSDRMLSDWGISSSDEITTLGDALKLIVPEDRTRVEKLVQEAIEKRIPYHADYRVKRADGAIVWIEVHGLIWYDEKGNATRFFGSSVDITEHRRVEAALRQQEADLRAYAEAMPQMAFIADSKGDILYFNRRHYDYFGAVPGQMEAWRWREFPTQHPDDEARTLERWMHSLRTGEQYEIEYRLRRKDGAYRWHLGRAVCLRDEQGRITRWFGTNTDIHDFKTAQDELVRSNVELAHFAYVASHDLKEPIRVISNYAQMLSKTFSGQLGERGDQFIHHIVNNVARMYDLINDLLGYSRLGAEVARREPVDLNDILCTVREVLGASLEETGGMLTASPLPTIAGDRTHLIQLFQNLVGNAIKYRSKQPPRIEVTTRTENGELIYDVRDNGIGIGIESEYFDKIFVLFQRLHGKGEYSGTGIGLAVCKKIVEQHGGRIWVNSDVGVGTTFSFTLPGGSSATNAPKVI